jgi:hypothetical protein
MKGRHFEKDHLGFIKQLINILFCGYRRLEIREQSRNLYSPGHRVLCAPASNYYIFKRTLFSFAIGQKTPDNSLYPLSVTLFPLLTWLAPVQ